CSVITEPLEAQGISTGREARRRAGELLELVGLSAGDLDRYPHQFSGGQAQRIAIARALSTDPRLLVCDEAVSALDVSVQAQVLNLLRRLQAELDLAYLFIAHDLNVVRYVSDRVCVMYLGRIVEQGPADQLLADPRHPYTQSLAAAIAADPRSGVRRRRGNRHPGATSTAAPRARSPGAPPSSRFPSRRDRAGRRPATSSGRPAVLEYVVRRGLYGVLVVALVTVFVFLTLRLIPGDVVRLQLADAPGVGPEQIAQRAAQLRLDQPLLTQLGRFVADAVTGDFGTSFQSGEPVTALIAERLPTTLQLGVMALLVSVVLGVPLGLLSAVRQNSWLDQGLRAVSVAGLSIPNFWLGLLLVTYLALWFSWSPPLVYRTPAEDLGSNLVHM